MILSLAVFDHNRPQSPHPYACTTIFFFFYHFISHYHWESLGRHFLSCPYDRIDRRFPSKFPIQYQYSLLLYEMDNRERILSRWFSWRFDALLRFQSQKPKHLPHFDPLLGADFPISADPRRR